MNKLNLTLSYLLLIFSVEQSISRLLLFFIVESFRPLEKVFRPIRCRQIPIDHSNYAYDAEDNTCVVEIFCPLMEVLVESQGQYKKARGYEEPDAGNPTDWD
jgi:hypothetical protein